MSVKTKSSDGCFGGQLMKLTHDSTSTGSEMTFNLYLPPQAYAGKKVPVIMFLAGMTCTEDNCAQKGFYQNAASKHGIAVLYPDTSPRGCNIQGEDDSWDFGTGSSWYVDATIEPFSKNYKMYTYVTEELPKVVEGAFGDKLDFTRVGLSGNSMGGHGALMLFLKNPGKYKSATAIAPAVNPLKCGWGQKVFKGYFGEKDWETKGAEYDSCELMKKWKNGPLDILIDVGEEDNFGKQGQLLAENLVETAKSIGQPKGVTLRMQPGYTHSYYTVASFADDHVNHHAKYLFAYDHPYKKQKL